MTAKDNQITFLQLRCKALEEENERLKDRIGRLKIKKNPQKRAVYPGSHC